MSTNCFHFSNHICGFRGGETPQGTSKQPSAKHVSLHLEKKPEIFFFAKKLNSALVILVQCSVICLPVKLSICNCGEWEEEGSEKETTFAWWETIFSPLLTVFFFPPPTRDKRQWFGAGSHLVAGRGWAANHWHLTPPKCDGRALTNQTEIWPNFPLYIWQIYCQSLDWFLLLGHKETE